jgi:hypothetical protein
MFDNSIPRPLKDFAAREFSGEKLVWAAQPDVRIAFWLSFGIWLFAIPWTAFSLFWISIPAAALYEAYTGIDIRAPKGAPTVAMWAFALWGVPFVLIGFGMLLAPFWALRKGVTTLYALTNKRIAILSGSGTISVVSIRPEDIMSLSRKEGPDGRGTLILHQGFMRDSDGDRQEKTTEFGVINDVRRIEQLVLEMKNKATAV